ncbi:MAG: hydrogenase nickel incorporation protein HypB [Deltaproteobacteria bacterium]|jgi:hydrogenase nickel incorporation protein HypB|nr:hydrogenase nickel incorporation protein HypB [Deltaproteobacteria bacterium]
MEISIGRSLLEANDREAEELRQVFAANGLLVLNLISSPGAGKTSLLEKTLTALGGEFRFGVIEGDLQTDNDARRVEKSGAKAVQINTHGGCHLDSGMIREVIGRFNLDELDILFIENVGNLVCPVEFDLGEDCKIALLSVTEGDDKPEKYPRLFHLAEVLLLNKIDILPYVDFDLERAAGFARAARRDLKILPVSCRGEGHGLEAWYDWLRQARAAKKTLGKTTTNHRGVER